MRIPILDACHNLEKLPDELGSLKKLTYFWIYPGASCWSICPKNWLCLLNFGVLKGFSIVDATGKDARKYTDLAGLKKLNRLNITNKQEGFPCGRTATHSTKVQTP